MTSSPSIRWFFLQKTLFRILFIYFVLFATNWIGFFSFIPGVTFLTGLWEQAEIWMVQLFNNLLWHLKDEVAPAYNGSGDSSYSWAYLYTMIFLSVVGGIIWSVVDWKRPNYINLDFWLRNLVRYTVALWAFYYGIIKIFALQMPFPNLSLLATPLGDLLPMRLSWMFIGYSVPYQFFSGLMEVLVGIFLFFRPTITLGALMGVGVFANVAMLNLSYDIPVKIFSLQLLFCCLYLSSNDWLRVLQFFFFNQATKPDHSYQMNLRQPWHRIAHIVAKLAFVGVFMAMPFFQSLTRYQTKGKVTVQKPFTPGVYQVQSFVRNRDTIPFTIADSTHWKDMIFNEDGARASINSNDTLFFQRYRRGYFSYQVDTAKKTMSMKKTPADTAAFLTMQYQILSPGKIRLWTVLRGDSLNMVIQRSKRYFQLTERQFHWVSEENR